ncbi:MAG TPA: tetratricopeptide repeat protein, partial [Firmicutes bacterium]|nr:tetratricopeptide repeat protein [Bacillota bacterium]
MEVQQKIDFIKELIQKGDLAVAQEELSKIIRVDPKNTKAFQLLAKIFINNDELENANRLFEQRKEIPSTYEEKITWAILLEEIGNMNDAISDYKDLLEINPTDSRIHYKLGVLYLDKYDYENALKHFKEIIRRDPNFIKDHDEIAELYKELGLMGMVKDILTPAGGGGIFNDFKIDIMVKEDSANKVIDFINLNESFYDRYITLFSGREGVIARQWTDNEGNSGYSPVYEELNEENITKHVRGDITLGIYPIDKSNMVNFAALDIDLRKNFTEDTVLGEERLKELKNQVLISAGVFKKIIDRLQLEAYLEDSGYKGIHIWFFFQPKVQAKEARNFLLMLIKKANLTKPEIHIEVFPKQNTVEEDKLGNLIKIPLGIHRKTLKRCIFIDSNGNPYMNQLEFIKRIKTNSPESLVKAVSEISEIPNETFDKISHRQPVKIQEGNLMSIEENCNVINFIVKKAKSLNDLLHEERV